VPPADPADRPLSRRRLLATGAGALGGVALAGAAGLGYTVYRVNQVGRYPSDRLLALHGGRANALFERFPALYGRLPWQPLADVPTPVEPWPAPPGMRRGTLYVKRDDLTARLYGGNKVRKLEHLLAEAALREARSLVTIGGIGSNQALATALHGRALGFAVELSLFDHPVTAQVKANLLGDIAAGACIRHAPDITGCLLNARRAFVARTQAGERPYFISVGGSTRLGNTGFVTAGLELAAQLRAGALPVPDAIFIAAGSCGTVAGLIAGLKLAGLSSRVFAVRTAEALFSNRAIVTAYAADVLRFLHSLDPTIPNLNVTGGDFELVGNYLGAAYAAPTPAARAAVDWAAAHVPLETTYTGKALAACLDYCAGPGRDHNVLFWNTFNSQPFARAAGPERLPASLQALFASHA
jgi:1-aminocyclopropane-1-carboxylate deaminase/D-cysteine desulfhydrase-like pyridoxal-dependent ACC family enzyme